MLTKFLRVCIAVDCALLILNQAENVYWNAPLCRHSSVNASNMDVNTKDSNTTDEEDQSAAKVVMKELKGIEKQRCESKGKWNGKSQNVSMNTITNFAKNLTDNSNNMTELLGKSDQPSKRSIGLYTPHSKQVRRVLTWLGSSWLCQSFAANRPYLGEPAGPRC